ncbi:phage terminase large subunit family protein [Rhizorhabdus wittichii]|uniref:Phage terminase large subunit family protein n=1 Tax=Rhizorhabdus wittichii TaxID=160791 RepID=A0A975HBQ8_9SPHN|nr:terminase gpA endonuclease subunit [Rhizorhabdus wittichii]QTH19650.1 phage terminase large subunit family protein [Rhizorhabdus wittichii]
MTFQLLADLEREFLALGQGAYCASAHDIAGGLVSLVLPPENISTVECAGQYRYLPDPEGDGKRLYDPGFTPYMIAPQNALDNPRYRFVIVPGPGRTGKSIGGENHLFKRLRNGPLTDAISFLPAGGDIDSYADKEFADFFSERLHPEIFAKLGPRSTDRKRKFKRVDGRAIQLLAANDGNVRQKQAPFIHATEIDGYRDKLRAAMKDLIHVRMRAYGNMAKAYLESHCDAGWNGIAGMWKDSTRGLWYWPCMRCGGWSSPHPLAARGFYMPLIYDRQDSLGDDEMLNLVSASAGMRCPHCGQLNLEADKRAMLDAGDWVFAGQVIDRDGKVIGDPRESESAGFWIHGTMSPMVSHAELARGYVAALVHFERTKKPERLKEWTVKSMGPVYEGAGGPGSAINPELLRERAQAVAEAEGFVAGTVPDDVLFVTSAVDVGGSKFDVMIIGWDLEGRWWVLERFTIRQRMVRGRMVDIRPSERIEDWDVLREQVLERELPLQSDPNRRLPVAAMAIDTGDGNVTWKAREFARRMAKAGQYWGSAAAPWHKVRLIKGAKSAAAPELPVVPRTVSKDEQGQKVEPIVLEYDLGVHRLKTQSVERIAVTEDGPGYGRFAIDLPASTFDEFAGEVLIDDEWDRRGPNESLDLLGYNEATRLMLQPHRIEIHWDVPSRRPVWARPVAILSVAEAQAPAAKSKSFAARMAAMNSGG